MAKVGYAAGDAVETGLNFNEGWGEVVEISAIVHQFPANKTTGEQSDPGTMVRMMIQRTDADGKHTQDDPIEEFFGCGSLEKFHPGVADSATDPDPEDQGTEVGAEGNCLWSDGSKINKRSKWAIFTSSLEAKGFRPDILSNGFLPDLVGLKGFFTSIAMPKDADRVYKRDPKALVMQNITARPYEGKGKGGAKAAAAAAPKNGKVSAPAAKAAAAASNGAGDDGEVDALATQLFVKMAENLAGQSLPRTKIPGKLVSLLAKGPNGNDPVSPKLHKPIQEVYKNDAWLAEKAADLDYAFDDGVLTFPAA